MYVRRPRKGVRKLRKRASRAPKVKTVSTAVKKYVKRALHTQVENKCVQINFGNSFGNVAESPDFNAYPMCPLSGFWSIPQGITQGTRVGNQIRTRKCYLSYILRPTPYDLTTNSTPVPTEVQLMLGYVKNTPCFQPVASDISQLFQSGASVTAPVGNLRDIISTINTDFWVIKKRWNHKIGYASATGTGSSAGNQFFANNDFKLNVVRKIDITKMIPTLFQFNDSSITPTSKNLFFMYYAVAASGVTLGNIALPTNIEYWIDYHYEDA